MSYGKWTIRGWGGGAADTEMYEDESSEIVFDLDIVLPKFKRDFKSILKITSVIEEPSILSDPVRVDNSEENMKQDNLAGDAEQVVRSAAPLEAAVDVEDMGQLVKTPGCKSRKRKVRFLQVEMLDRNHLPNCRRKQRNASYPGALHSRICNNNRSENTRSMGQYRWQNRVFLLKIHEAKVQNHPLTQELSLECPSITEAQEEGEELEEIT